MILVDTSVWIDHFRSHDNELAALLSRCQVLMHPYVLGELARRNFSRRVEVLKLLDGLPRAAVASDTEARFFIEQHSLMGKGIGYIDMHLLASVVLESTAKIWTRDRRLNSAAENLSLAC